MAAARTNRAGASPGLQSKGFGQKESTGCRKKRVCVFGEVFSQGSRGFWLPAAKELSPQRQPRGHSPGLPGENVVGAARRRGR